MSDQIQYGSPLSLHTLLESPTWTLTSRFAQSPDEYKPILQEIERIQAAAGLEAEDVQKAASGAAGALGEGSRNRR